MSGLEIAGLVLGALPLAIEVLNWYEQVAKLTGRFVKIRAEYKECLRQLRYHRLCYDRNLKDLLLPLIIDDAEKGKITELINDPFGSWWTEPDTARLLEERLADGYEVYMDCIEMMEKLVEEILTELAWNNSSVQDMIKAPVSPYRHPEYLTLQACH